MLDFLIAATLFGYTSNCEGRIGVRIGLSGYVSHVYNIGASAKGIIYEGDQVLEADGKRGTDNIMGPVGSYVNLKVKRCGEIKEFEIIRVDKKGVKD